MSGTPPGRPVPVNPAAAARLAGLPPATGGSRRERAAPLAEGAANFFRDWQWFPFLFATTLAASLLSYCRPH